MILVPLLLATGIAVPYVLLPVLWAIPVSFVGVLSVSAWTSLRQRPDPRSEPQTLRLPVTGRWRALNTPATRVPSHGTHFLAQSYAFDLVGAEDRPTRPLLRRVFGLDHPGSYPAFGRAVVAPAMGTVMKTADWSRDHRGRDSALGLILWFVEQMARTFTGMRGLVGNYLVIEIGEGVFVMCAHLKQGSIDVCAGDVVDAGQVIALCGNSGNSTEPHLHFQVMDNADPWKARGLPVIFSGYRTEGDAAETIGVPVRGETVRPG